MDSPQREIVFLVFLETVFLSFVCQCDKDFPGILNAAKLGKVLK